MIHRVEQVVRGQSDPCKLQCNFFQWFEFFLSCSSFSFFPIWIYFFIRYTSTIKSNKPITAKLQKRICAFICVASNLSSNKNRFKFIIFVENLHRSFLACLYTLDVLYILRGTSESKISNPDFWTNSITNIIFVGNNLLPKVLKCYVMYCIYTFNIRLCWPTFILNGMAL